MLTEDEKKKLAELQAKEKEDGELEDANKKVETSGISADELVSKLVDKLADAIVAKKGGSEGDKSELANKILAPDLKGQYGKGASIKTMQYPDDLTNLTKDQKIMFFFKALVMRQLDPYEPQHNQVFKALVEGTNADGGFLVPDELRAEVFRILPDFAVMRSLARVIPMTSDTLLLNSLNARPVAYWTAEYAEKTTSSAEFAQKTLSVHDLVCLLPVTQQLVADANINVVQFILQLFAEAIAQAEDKAFFTGTDTTQPRGINQETLTSVAGPATFDTIISLIYALPQRVRQARTTAFVMNKEILTSLHKIKNSDGDYIWKAGSGSADGTVRVPETLLGYPVYEQNDLEKSIFFGDWSYYIIGDRQQMTVETTTVGGEAWRRNAMEIKTVERVDGRAVLTGAFAELTNA